MAIIYSYQKNNNILDTDLLLGTTTMVVNGRSKNQTKSFKLQELAEYFTPKLQQVNSVIRNTYALMIADGPPTVDTIYTVLNDENKSYVRATYFWKTNGQREWIASTPDN